MTPIEDKDGRVVATFDRSAAMELASNYSCRGPRQNAWTNLLRTARGKYVMHHVNHWQGARCWYELVDVATAAQFAAQHADEEDLPEDLQAAIRAMEV
jgi:hypothetical protein